MLIANISKFWPSKLWRYLRPTELIRGVVSSCRLLWNSLAHIGTVIENNIPVGTGELYVSISVPLSRIGKNRNIAGVGTIFSEEFPYAVTGVLPGVVRFAPTTSAIGACLYSDFIEIHGVYYFKDRPTKFGIITTKNGNCCNFIVTTATASLPRFSDSCNRFNGSCKWYANRVIDTYDTQKQSTGGVSNRLPLLAAGVTVSPVPGKVTKQWMEGGVLFAVLDDKVLLRDATAAGEVDDFDKLIDAGQPLTENCFSTITLYADDNGIVHKIPEGNVILADYPGLLKRLPQLPADIGELDSNVVNGLLRGSGTVTINTTYGDSECQRAIEKRINSVSTLYLAQRVSVDFGQTPHAANYIYAIVSSDPGTTIKCYEGITPNNLIFNNSPRITVLRIPVESGTAISCNGECFGRKPTAGEYVTGVVLVSGEQDYRKDVILKHIKIEPTPIHAGATLIFDFLNL